MKRVFPAAVLFWLLCLALPASAQFRLPFFDYDNPDVIGDEKPAERNSANNKLRSETDAAYKAGSYAQAIELASQVIAAEPEQPFAYYQRASAKIELGRSRGSAKEIREGIADAREALRLGGQKYPFLYVPYFYGLTSLSETEQKPSHIDLLLQVAEPVLQRTDLTGPTRAQLLYQRGRGQLAKKEYTAAAADFTEAGQLDNSLLAAHLGVAQAFSAANKHAEAKAAYDRAVNLAPREAIVYNERGTYLNNRGDRTGAIGDFTYAIQFDPKMAYAYINRGIAISAGNKPEDLQAAEADYLQALQIDPNLGLGHRFLGSVRVAMGKLKPAVQSLGYAVKLMPQDPAAYAERGFARFYLEEYPAAAEDFAQSLKLNPKQGHLRTWHYLSRAKAGEAAAGPELVALLKTPAAPPGWSGLLCKYLTDAATEADLTASVAKQPAASQPAFRCEAEFFTAQKLLLKQDADAAQPHFEAALKEEIPSLSAWRGAKYALGAGSPTAASK